MSISMDIDAAQRVYRRDHTPDGTVVSLSQTAVQEGCRRGRELHALAVTSALHSLSSAIGAAFGVSPSGLIRSSPR